MAARAAGTDIAGAAPTRRRPQGFLVAIGGNEDKEFGKAVLKGLCELPHGGTRVVEVIPTASMEPGPTGEAYLRAFGALGIPEVHVMDLRRRSEADRREAAERIRAADVVFLTGGDQLRITSILGGTLTARALREHYHNGGVVAGTSAGAAAMSGTMIFEGEPNRGMRKGSVQMTPGLGLLETCVIDTHFLDRGRLSRLLEVVASNPGYIGIGLGEDTGIIVRDGDHLEAIGKGVVVLVDGHDLRYTNITEIPLHAPIAAQNITVHTLVAGHQYHVGDRRYIVPGAATSAAMDTPLPRQGRPNGNHGGAATRSDAKKDEKRTPEARP